MDKTDTQSKRAQHTPKGRCSAERDDGIRKIEYGGSECQQLYNIFLAAIAEGCSYPQTLPFSVEDFKAYFFAQESSVFVCENQGQVAGGFYIKPNFPGRCSHIANAGYVVDDVHRGKGYGKLMGQASIEIAAELGFKALMFNLVFCENIASIRLWRRLGFNEIGKIPAAVNKADGSFCDAIIFYKTLASGSGSTASD